MTNSIESSITRETPQGAIDIEQARREMVADQLADSIHNVIKALPFIDGGSLSRFDQARVESYYHAGIEVHGELPEDRVLVLGLCKSIIADRTERKLRELRDLSEGELDDHTLFIHPDLQQLHGMSSGLQMVTDEALRDA